MPLSWEKRQEIAYELRDEDRQYRYELSHRASEKSIDYARLLIERAKSIPQLRETAENLEVRLTKTDGHGFGYNVVPYNICVITYTIDFLKDEFDAIKKAKQIAEPVATTPTEEASAKQRGFIKSLVKKKEVPAEILAQVDEALTDKRKASALIQTLLALTDKAA
jgi:hypothetical protein